MTLEENPVVRFGPAGPIGTTDAWRAGQPPEKPVKSVCFDLGPWHGGPECTRTFVSGIGGIGVKVCCAHCGIVADVEAVGARISISQSYVEGAMRP